MTLKAPEQKSGHLVIPGERLGVIEEFIPDSGTYVKDGVIYSKIVGRSLLDLQNRRVSVYPATDAVVVPKVGTVVIGQIGNAQSDNVLVKIFRVGKKKIAGTFGGILHVSDVSDRYVELMSDVCKPGDIIRAKVISEKNQVFHLSTNDKTLGVLYGFCSRDGTLLNQDRYDLKCPKCGNVERRKMAPDYGKDFYREGKTSES
ncbi:MAG: exosome complex RNA-binding protein Csl4 [Nitrososphaerota archaeon]|jgi:exosome complex component CSL4|uniref:exosome complex RNA-binding protein Csl4 n=1 Tax=Candidatus Bathycorpusculum sp. TaxID=2994959 RepID=UPI002839CF98|nr:exosome complex RNA-binding protein Csl4 [Candidatus Termitimicrobium sp.]MCL2432250.1 exosome complex RNA-binding protein Csl4 [Candidatus Termitimicrobium sp.]MDR0492055.1 exosome complex RNA-binding protein Csl4 [Nitrososphaerota archaeon]